MVAKEDGVTIGSFCFNTKAFRARPADTINLRTLDRPLLFHWVPNAVIGGQHADDDGRAKTYILEGRYGRQPASVNDKHNGHSYQDNQARTLAMSNGDLDYVKDRRR